MRVSCPKPQELRLTSSIAFPLLHGKSLIIDASANGLFKGRPSYFSFKIRVP